MKTIFDCLGIQVSTKKTSDSPQKISVLYINNPDGSIRWLWNKHCKKPIFLQFYNVNNLKAKLFQLFVQFIFALKIQRLIFKQKNYFYSCNYSFFEITKEWAIFTGTIGPNRKAILLQNNQFYKIGLTKNAIKLLCNEYQTLQKLHAINHQFVIPKATFIQNHILKLENINHHGHRNNTITAKHQNFVVELSNFNQQIKKTNEYQYFNILKSYLNNFNDERFPKNFIKKLKVIVNQINAEEQITIHFSHGDFTPWNCFALDNKIGVYDWELAANNKPKGFDYFHFIIQNNILVHQKPWNTIYKELVQNKDFNQSFFGNPEEFEKYLKWYFICNTLQHLELYQHQEKWHPQIYWLIETWNDALNNYVASTYNQRQLLIMDVFDQLNLFKYAALKFEIEQPEDLNLNSDIDLIINKKDYKTIINYLTNHSLVKNCTKLKKSFMASIQLQTNDDNILSLDLIWKLKYKNIQLLNAQNCIQTRTYKSNGISVVNPNLTAKYIGLFYSLNLAYIPTKYWHYHQNLDLSKPLDQILNNHYQQFKESRKDLIFYLKSLKENTGLGYLKNTLEYFIDTLKTIYYSKGFVMTFSGVDGAGKSTIIENISQIIEKKYRRNIIVLRHRPSVLPILSVFTKGKKGAQAHVLNSLPRQGNNKNIVSSILRFTYYYTDYIIGQFYIYFKYTLRGTIVIYDRYYFDFINDSKRSNIILPKFITKTGYILLVKPKYNFFLYADVDTILKRKQELTANTIQTLTQDYQDLFDYLNKQNKHKTYQSILNIQIDQTINQIMNTLKIEAL